MRDNFFGDLGDFGKYGLLRALCGLTPRRRSKNLPLGVNWYFIPDRGVKYLDEGPVLSQRDPDLFSALYDAVKGSRRKVGSVPSMGFFDPNTVYFDAPVPAAVDKRRRWIAEADEKMHKCELIFMDPDNGLIADKLGDGKVSPKHVYSEELQPFVARGQSLVVYHHIPRRRAEDEASRCVAQLRHGLSTPQVWVLKHTSRLYFIIPGRHESVLKFRLDQFLNGPWGDANRYGFRWVPIK